MYLVDFTDTVYYLKHDIYTDVVEVTDLHTGEEQILAKEWMRAFYLQVGNRVEFAEDTTYDVAEVYYRHKQGQAVLSVKLISNDDDKEYIVDETIVRGLMEKFI